MEQPEPLLPLPVSDALKRVGKKLAVGGDLSISLHAALAAIATLPPSQIARLDGDIARAATLGYQQHGGIKWVLAGMPSDARRLLATPGLERLFVFHRDGRLREAALQRLTGGLDGPFGVGAVLWRLNDWVPQVRAAARRCAARTLPLTDATVVTSALAAVLVQQASWGRWTDERSVLYDQLVRPNVAAALARSIRENVAGPWASVLRAALQTASLDGELALLATDGMQPAVRAIALKVLIDREAVWPVGWAWRWIDKSLSIRRRERTFARRPVNTELARVSMIERGATDRSAVVRRVALAGIIRHALATDEGRVVAARLKDDPAASVREKARFILDA